MALPKKKVKSKGKPSGGKGNVRANVKTTGTKPIAGLSAEQMSGGELPDEISPSPLDAAMGNTGSQGGAGKAKQKKPSSGY